MADLDLFSYVERARNDNPKPLLTADEVAACLYRAAQLAQADGFDVGVLLKPHGSGGMSPVGRISLDILIDIPDQQEYDAFGSADGENGAPGPAIPVWNKLPFKVGVPPSGASMDRVRRPLALPPGDEETDPPAPPPHTDPLPPLLDVSALEQRIIAGVLAGLQPQLALAMGAASDARLAAEAARDMAGEARVIELRLPYFGTARGVIKAIE